MIPRPSPLPRQIASALFCAVAFLYSTPRSFALNSSRCDPAGVRISELSPECRYSRRVVGYRRTHPISDVARFVTGCHGLAVMQLEQASITPGGSRVDLE